MRLWVLRALVLAAVFLPVTGRAQSPAGPRVVASLGADWTFQYFPSPTEPATWSAVGADDSKWPAVALPHTWSVYETTRELHPFEEHATEREDSYWWYGWGWYRKHVTIASRYASRRAFLEFDGVQKYARVYVNGTLVGEHKGGYTSFSLDVTRWVRFGQDNVIAVQVSNRRDDDFGHIPPMTAGNFDVYGGIYRSVRLVLTNPVYVPFQGSADSEGGSFITTPKVSEKSATVNDTTWVKNAGEAPARVSLRSQIFDAEGKLVDTQASEAELAAGELKGIAQVFAPIAKPHLWSPESPYVYRMVSEVSAGGQVVDRYESAFGVRWFSWSHEQKRLMLNGRPIRLIGTNRHQDFPWLGDAVPLWMQIADLNDIRYNEGYNFQRTAHYPQAPAVYDYADRSGIILTEESPNIKDIAFGRDVQRQTMVEMIRRDRNHPSIFFWGIGNETDHPADSTWAWDEDRTRIINLRRGTNGGDHVMTTDVDLPLEQTLRCTVRGWYNDDAHNFAPGNGEPASGQVTGTEEWQHATDAKYLLQKQGQNVVVFLYADHGADRIYRNSPLVYINPKGWVDGLRFPKYVYYLWQANFTERAMVFVHPWPWQQRYLGKEETITVDSNGDSVELFVDGRSVGVQKPSDANAHVVEFRNVRVTAGTLRAVAHKQGLEVEQTLTMASQPVALRLRVREQHLVADRSGLAIVEVRAVDAKGVEVPYIHPELTWTVRGEGKLVGPAKLVTDTDKNGAHEGTMYIDLPTANLVRTTNVAGRIEVTVSSPGLQAATVVLESTPAKEGAEGIAQPVLSDAGRVAVARDPRYARVASRLPPRVFEHIAQDYKLEAGTERAAEASLAAFLHEHNPKLQASGPAYVDAEQKLTELLMQNRGNLIADWYNFTADQYEDVEALASVIEQSGAPRAMKDALEKEYADRILLRGEAVDVDQETKRLAAKLARQ